MINNDRSLNTIEENKKLCIKVRDLIERRDFAKSDKLIRQAMSDFPSAAEPHNLMGIQLEKRGDHLNAMKHFRAAWALNPAYLPARHNLNQFADMFCSRRVFAYVEDDCANDKIHYNYD